ncbi:MAG TPA: hypothetical protein VFI11_06730 [Anaerolineales bacterium]|nr:hypothetical protein [Anaerolineales bacterium]
MRGSPVFRLLIVLAAVSLACNLGGGAGQPTALDTPAAGAPATGAAPTEQPSGGLLELEPPPPGGLIDAFQERVESGAWTSEEGLIQSLRLFTGEATVASTYSEIPSNLEGFGIVREAQRYLRQGSDPATKAEIERLLGIIAPPIERLLEVSDPAPIGLGRGPGLGAPSSDVQDCEDLYAAGFPPGSGLKCMLVKEGGMSGQTFRVFYPIAYALPVYAEAAYGAATVAWNRYSLLTPPSGVSILKGIDIVFSLLNAQESATILAMVPSESTDQRCLIVVYLPAIQANEQTKSSPDDFSHFAQTIAHEVFHCFQVWNFPEQSDDAWAVQDWWGEGTAAYFSNVVYPEVNAEWEFLGGFVWKSANTSLLQMSYENFAFFQFLSSKIGDNGILQLIGKMPFGGGEAAQATALADFPAVQTLFHDFGRATIDGSIVDTGGKTLPTYPPLVPEDHQIEVYDAEIRSLTPPPFVLDRHAIRFVEGREYTVEKALTGSAEGLDGARNVLATATWGEMPPIVSAGCAPIDYYVLVTSTQASGGSYALELTMLPKRDLGCDECLVGTWDIDIDSFAEYAEAPFADTPGMYQFDSAGGLWRYHFRADGTMRGEFDFFYSYHINQKNEPLGNDITIDSLMTIVGTGEGTYSSDGLSNLGFALTGNSVVFSQEMYMNGDKVAEGPIDPSGLGGYGSATGASAVYSCDDEAGELLLNTAPQTGLPPILYNRVSKEP